MTNEHRHLRPWIVVYAHRPLYCSGKYCFEDSTALRDGITEDGGVYYGLEDVLYSFGVDFYFSGHMHAYERIYPTYKSSVLGTDYNNPRSTVYIVDGAAGNYEGPGEFEKEPPVWSSFRSTNSSIGYLTIHNTTHAHWNQVNADGTPLDQIWVVSEYHGPFGVE